jgi:hypothetical protein
MLNQFGKALSPFGNNKPSTGELFQAAAEKRWGVLVAHVNRGNVNLADPTHGAPLLHWVAKEGHVPTLEHLLSVGANTRAVDPK